MYHVTWNIQSFIRLRVSLLYTRTTENLNTLFGEFLSRFYNA